MTPELGGSSFEPGVGAGDHVRAAPMQSGAMQSMSGREVDPIEHFLRHYSLLLLPVALLIAINPRRALRLATRVVTGVAAWQSHPGPIEARILGIAKQLIRREL